LKECLAEIPRGRHGDPHDGLTRALERRHRIVLSGIGRYSQSKVDEKSVLPVCLGPAESLPIDGDETLALLARRLGEQLLEPGADLDDSRRRDDRHLVAPRPAQGAEHRAEHHAGVFTHRHAGEARVHQLLGGVEERGYIEAHRGCRHHAERRKSRVAPADAGLAQKDAPVPPLGGDVLQALRRGIGDHDEVAPRFRLADGAAHAIVEIIAEEIRLERGARLRRHDEQRLVEV
jgi:hypothetical protein